MSNMKSASFMGKATALFAFMLCLLMWKPVANAQARIAVVNLAKLVADSPQATSARSRMEQSFASRRKGLESQQQSLIADAEKLKTDAAIMSEDEKNALKRQLAERQRDLTRQQAVYNQDVAKKEQEELNRLRESILSVVKKVARRDGYDLVLGDGVIYASDAVDLTATILAEMQNLPQ